MAKKPDQQPMGLMHRMNAAKAHKHVPHVPDPQAVKDHNAWLAEARRAHGIKGPA